MAVICQWNHSMHMDLIDTSCFPLHKYMLPSLKYARDHAVLRSQQRYSTRLH